MFGSLTSFESLFDEFRRIEQDMDALFSGWAVPTGIRSVARGHFPAANVGVTPDAVDVYLFAPGIDPKSLDLSVQQNLLLISGERRPSLDEKATYYRQERFGGEFRRVIPLPDDADPEQVDAKYRDGVLHVSLRRKESARPRQISVQ